MNALLSWLHPATWAARAADKRMAALWGARDAGERPDVRDMATQHSLSLLDPATHQRYWDAYWAAREEN